MAIAVRHGGDPIPKSPFHINVAPLLDLSKVSIQGLNSSEYICANVPSDSVAATRKRGAQVFRMRAYLWPLHLS